MTYLYSFIIFLFNILIFFKLDQLSKIINLYDIPDKKRKIHLKKVPAVGGFILMMNLFFFLILNYFFKIFNFDYLIFFIFCLSIFIIALIDDKFDISANQKFIFISFIIFFFFYFNQDKLITNIVFEFYFLRIDSYYVNFFVSYLCVMLFLNAVNLFDGVNGQVAIYSIFVFVFFLWNNIFYELSIFLLIPIIFFTYYNIKGKIFLGDNGSFLIAFIISFLILSNNTTKYYLNAETIFLIMFLPGMDMLRLFVERIVNKQNPFKADQFHIHHLLLKRFTTFQRIFFNILIYILPLLLSYKLNKLAVIILLVLFYLLFIYKYLGNRLFRNQ